MENRRERTGAERGNKRTREAFMDWIKRSSQTRGIDWKDSNPLFGVKQKEIDLGNTNDLLFLGKREKGNEEQPKSIDREAGQRIGGKGRPRAGCKGRGKGPLGAPNVPERGAGGGRKGQRGKERGI